MITIMIMITCTEALMLMFYMKKFPFIIWRYEQSWKFALEFSFHLWKFNCIWHDEHSSVYTASGMSHVLIFLSQKKEEYILNPTIRYSWDSSLERMASVRRSFFRFSKILREILTSAGQNFSKWIEVQNEHEK